MSVVLEIASLQGIKEQDLQKMFTVLASVLLSSLHVVQSNLNRQMLSEAAWAFIKFFYNCLHYEQERGTVLDMILNIQ